jgi:hypothetical protein
VRLRDRRRCTALPLLISGGELKEVQPSAREAQLLAVLLPNRLRSEFQLAAVKLNLRADGCAITVSPWLTGWAKHRIYGATYRVVVSTDAAVHSDRFGPRNAVNNFS